jgi:hypothetical protein
MRSKSLIKNPLTAIQLPSPPYVAAASLRQPRGVAGVPQHLGVHLGVASEPPLGHLKTAVDLKYGWHRSPELQLRWQTRLLDHLHLHLWSLSLSLSLSLSYTDDVLEELIDMIILSRGCDGVDACGWRVDVKLDCGKHKCCSNFKHS